MKFELVWSAILAQGVLLSFIAVRWNKAYVLAATLALWSIMTGAAGFTSKFWQVALVRVGQSVFEAGCTPFAAGLISAYFPPHIKGTAMSVYNIGVYAGEGLACLPLMLRIEGAVLLFGGGGRRLQSRPKRCDQRHK